MLMMNPAGPVRLWNTSDIAHVLGVTRQAIQGRYKRGKLPAPDFLTQSDIPLWYDQTLKEGGILS